MRKYFLDKNKMAKYKEIVDKWIQTPEGKKYLDRIKVEGNPMHVGHAFPVQDELSRNIDPNLRLRNYLVGNYQLVRQAWDFAKENKLENDLFREMLTLGGCLDGVGARLQDWLFAKQYVLQQKGKEKLDYVSYEKVAEQVVNYFEDYDAEYNESDFPLAKKIWDYVNAKMTVDNKPLDPKKFFEMLFSIILVDNSQEKIANILKYLQNAKSPLKNNKTPHTQVEMPQAQKSQVQKPQVQKPQVQKPQVQKPQAQKPQVQKPQVQKPQVQKPQVQKPHQAKPVEQPHKAKEISPSRQWKRPVQGSNHSVRAAIEDAEFRIKANKESLKPATVRKDDRLNAKAIKSIIDELAHIDIQKLYDGAGGNKSFVSKYLKMQHRDRPSQILYLQSHITIVSSALNSLLAELPSLSDDKKKERLESALKHLDNAVNEVESQMRKSGHHFKGTSRLENVHVYLRNLTNQLRKTYMPDLLTQRKNLPGG
ncbi:MAG: hypothetical protein AB7V32_07700 [Candidatus Berkiella sp.]